MLLSGHAAFNTPMLHLQAWIEEVSAFVKAADPNHLVTVGEEGFYGPGSPDLGSNPSPGLCTPQGLTMSRLSGCRHMSNLVADFVSADSQSLHAKL